MRVLAGTRTLKRVYFGNSPFGPLGLVASLAEELKADLIVVGSHGRHGLALIMGSTANGVLHGAKRDVLAVRVYEGE